VSPEELEGGVANASHHPSASVDWAAATRAIGTRGGEQDT
jgi:hypothetical protein